MDKLTVMGRGKGGEEGFFTISATCQLIVPVAQARIKQAYQNSLSQTNSANPLSLASTELGTLVWATWVNCDSALNARDVCIFNDREQLSSRIIFILSYLQSGRVGSFGLPANVISGAAAQASSYFIHDYCPKCTTRI